MRYEHEECDGLDHVIDQDGNSAYECGCYCNAQSISRTCPECKGKGTLTETHYTKNRRRAVSP
jgi:hypothetical protein